MTGGKASVDASQETVRVWDFPTRLFHWLLVISLAGSWITTELEFDPELGIEWMEWHFRFGYFAAGLIIFRIMWGLVGSRHARFTNFLYGPGRILAYAATLFKRDSKPTTGHTPVGGLVVLARILLIGAQVATGLFASDDIFFDGPFHPLVSDALAGDLTTWHHRLFTAIQIIVALHIVAVLFYWIWKGQQLIWPMITGRKRASQLGDDKAGVQSKIMLGIIVAAIAAGIVYGAVSMAPEPVIEDFY